MSNGPAETSSYIDDILEQPAALHRQADAPLPEALRDVDLRDHDRIILTGMGSSDYAAVPIERALASAGLPVVRIDAGQLLDVPQRVTNRTLVWATSQSGRSGEVAALADVLTGSSKPALTIATTDDTSSPLAAMADIVLELHSGPEATVSTKSYLNTLAAQHRALARMTGGSVDDVDADVRRIADEVSALLTEWPNADTFAQQAWEAPRARFAYIGIGDDAATALTGALITKESSKVPVEGFVGGAFRHGPYELAGPGLTAVLFGQGAEADPFLPGLAGDLVRSGATVLTVGPRAYPGTELLATPDRDSALSRLTVGSVRTQLLTLAFAKATGEVAGRFRFGQKVTAAL
ncbi:glutamine--fructose-6-phosphate aminotransferase [Curtobacterium sp. MCPF17_011]|uniref:SIS domain-containing protein n=1 Tax=unclassified Curtobacterium TaxID=257496 RepID=UPI000D996E07|nr:MULTISPECIES: SIS domain-containing protein [unclassified Curtobacterium]PYY38351.1 glutamine--fructose-6-phosphate aminotransferase [Curtobacterium sp. MCBD17_030]PZF14797.1 glutamine--fructose-6-phosphate aminotransferase [Curtobacterium sp. MCPF17_011]